MDIFNITPWVLATGLAGWIGKGLIFGKEFRKDGLDYEAVVEKTRNDLTIQLLSSARSEAVAARAEIEGLHSQVTSLRALEQHFFHFQQALDHLDAIVNASDAVTREAAERAGRAFVNRMRRLVEAKGTIANEVQTVDSALKGTEQKIRKEGGQL
jgi:peroxiredoxin